MDESGLPLIYTVDASGQEPGWSAIAVLDDRTENLGTTEHKLMWRSWLYWSNLLQFLAFAGGDGIQLASSQAADYPVEVLTIGGGIGELELLIVQRNPAADEVSSVADSRTAVLADAADAESTEETSLEKMVASVLRDRTWDEDILELLEEDEPESDLTRLAKKIAAKGKKAPVFGYELGERGWQTDFAWDDSQIKIAVVVAPDTHGSQAEEERRKRDEAYAADGWTVRTATDWLDHLDTLLTLLPDTEGSNS